MYEKVLATQTLFEGRIVKLDVQDVELPNGERSQREVMRHNGAAAIVAFDEADHVLLVRQFRSGTGMVMLELPAGVLDKDGESPLLCAGRELQEETGYRADHWQAIGGLHPAPGYSAEFIHLFIATGLHESKLPGDVDEFLELVRVPFRQALAMIDSGEITDAKTVIGLLRSAGLMRAGQ